MENLDVKQDSIGNILVKVIRTISYEDIKEISTKIEQLEEKNHDLYAQLNAAHREILSLKNRVTQLEYGQN